MFDQNISLIMYVKTNFQNELTVEIAVRLVYKKRLACVLEMNNVKK